MTKRLTPALWRGVILFALVWWGAVGVRAQTEPPPYDPERAYWADQAALLDPRAYELINGVGWTRTVPEGETWHALNLYRVKWAAAAFNGFLRHMDTRRAVLLPAGTTFSSYTAADGTPSTAYAYYARPKLVFDLDARYTNDPKGLYYRRLDRLRSLPLYEVNARVGANLHVDVTAFATFPADFDYGLVTLVSVTGGSWCGLAITNGDGTFSNLNAMEEISNRHALRFARENLMPFSRASFPRFSVKGGNASGDVAFPSGVGDGQLLYRKLPSDW